MEAADRLPFFQLLDDTCDAINMRQPLSAGAKTLMFQDLNRYPFNLIEAALAAHRQDPERGQWQPNTAHIEYQIGRRRRNNWIPADEAWARMPLTEGQPGILNQVTAEALAVAMPFLNQPRPDHNAARMAFRACYDRLVERQKLERRAPEYFVSPGGSPEAQQAVAEEGVRLGLLPAPNNAVQEDPARLLPSPTGQRALAQALKTLQIKHMPTGDGDD